MSIKCYFILNVLQVLLLSYPATAQLFTTTSTAAPPTTDGPGSFQCPSSEGFFAIPGYCGPDYIQCVAGAPYATSCPGGNYFDPLTSICVPPESASCVPTTVETTTPTTTEVNTADNTPSRRSTTTEPSTTTETSTTSTTTEPSTTTEQITTDTSTEATTVPTTTVPPFVCPGTGNFPYPDDCTLYYVCGGGTVLIAHCPDGEVFNPAIQFCDNPANVPECSLEWYYQPIADY